MCRCNTTHFIKQSRPTIFLLISAPGTLKIDPTQDGVLLLGDAPGSVVIKYKMNALPVVAIVFQWVLPPFFKASNLFGEKILILWHFIEQMKFLVITRDK